MDSNDTSMNSGPNADVVLSSRAAALRECVEVVAEGLGPIVVSGEPGIGKTWLRRRIAGMVQGLRWLEIDATPSWRSDDFLFAICRSAGLARTGDSAAARIAVDEFLVEESESGRRWALAIDEAQNASDEVLEEVRVLANRLGRVEGFEGLLLSGQTTLARRLGSRSLANLANRLAARVRLRPIDADEARILLEDRFPASQWELSLLERLHRDSWGNPARLLKLAEKIALKLTKIDRPFETVERVAPMKNKSEMVVESPSVPILGPSKPPIRLEDGLIEVGWDSESEADDSFESSPFAASADTKPEVARPVEAAILGVIESIDDPYAAIQAWDEWNRNRRAEEQESSESLADGSPSALEEMESIIEEESSEERSAPQVWPDQPRDFAPYSQLFTRARSLSDRESSE